MLLVAGDRDGILGGVRRRPGVCWRGEWIVGASGLHAYVSGFVALRCGIEDRILPIGGLVAGHVMGRVLDDLFQSFVVICDQGSGRAGPLYSLVVLDNDGEGEYAYAYTGSGASAVAFETELVFEGVVYRFDGLA